MADCEDQMNGEEDAAFRRTERVERSFLGRAWLWQLRCCIYSSDIPGDRVREGGGETEKVTSLPTRDKTAARSEKVPTRSIRMAKPVFLVYSIQSHPLISQTHQPTRISGQNTKRIHLHVFGAQPYGSCQPH